MNIFVLDSDLNKLSEYHADKHVVKMITEHNQMLCTAHHILNSKYISTLPKEDRLKNGFVPYSKTHSNHPCSIWVRESLDNYVWLCEATIKLCNEYSYRYGKTHKGEEVVKFLINNVPDIKSKGLTRFALAMPDDVKTDDVILSYRNYYKKYKKHLFFWKKRKIPEWICDG
jgi:hypothetical protein